MESRIIGRMNVTKPSLPGRSSSRDSFTKASASPALRFENKRAASPMLADSSMASLRICVNRKIERTMNLSGTADMRLEVKGSEL